MSWSGYVPMAILSDSENKMEGKGKDLSGKCLHRASLSGAVLRNADLSGAHIAAYLDSLGISPQSLIVEDFDAQILRGAETGLDMSEWHSDCGTKHCRAGWAVTVAGDAGRKLESLIDTSAAAAIIYAANGSHPTPDLYASDEDAMRDIRRRAKGKNHE